MLQQISIKILFLLLILLISGCSELKSLKVFVPHQWVGMKKVSSQLYVEEDMPKEKEKKILNDIPKAKKYLENIYGSVTTKPIIYACESDACTKSFGLGTARAVRLSGHLILTNRGFDKGIIAHEWSHEELYERIGGFYHWYKEVPTWFDEGLASFAMHKYRRYDERAWKRIIEENIPYPKKSELITLSQWTKANDSVYLVNDEIVVPYVVARHMVSMWYKKVGQKGFLLFLKGIRQGKKFEEVFGVGKIKKITYSKR